MRSATRDIPVAAGTLLLQIPHGIRPGCGGAGVVVRWEYRAGGSERGELGSDHEAAV